MSNNDSPDYLENFKDELESIKKLSETPNIIRDHAVSGINLVLEQELNYQAKMKLQNLKQSLENISGSSVKENYKIIYSQMCILAVSSLEATLKRYFLDFASKVENLNKDNRKLEEIKITALDLLNEGLNFTENFGQILLERETNSFQNLKLIKEVFKNYLSKEIKLSDEDEKCLVYYLELRHILVHKGGKIDERFVNSTKVMDANLGNYNIGNKVELDDEDWNTIEATFPKLISSLVES